ncbi:MAG: hypothetical protein LBJ13_02550 [Puniceicoccales bacterium]|jgi:hypothetical protein|nr:hypothetical protein [Puniceicoccales bacterium]
MTTKEQLTATRELVKLTQDAFTSSQQLMNLLDLFYPKATATLEIAIYTLNQTIELIRNLPEKFFKDDQSQAQFLVTAQKKLDELILQEEEFAGEAFLMEGQR